MLKDFLYSSSIMSDFHNYISSLLVSLIAFPSTSLNFNREHVLTFSVMFSVMSVHSEFTLLFAKNSFYTRMIKCLIVHCPFLLLFLIFICFSPFLICVLLLVCYTRVNRRRISSVIRFDIQRPAYYTDKRVQRKPNKVQYFWISFDH
jgi:hypothetical protein